MENKFDNYDLNDLITGSCENEDLNSSLIFPARIFPIDEDGMFNDHYSKSDERTRLKRVFVHILSSTAFWLIVSFMVILDLGTFHS